MGRRWHGYRDMLEGFPLVQFQSLDRWDRGTWISSLLRSPCIGDQKGAPWQFMGDVRDLQIIRPRTFGTLEFRADPAQGSVSAILAIAALRLACCAAAVAGQSRPGSFRRHCRDWWNRINNQLSQSRSQEPVQLLSSAHGWLEARGFGEERYLAPLRAALAEALSGREMTDGDIAALGDAG